MQRNIIAGSHQELPPWKRSLRRLGNCRWHCGVNGFGCQIWSLENPTELRNWPSNLSFNTGRDWQGLAGIGLVSFARSWASREPVLCQPRSCFSMSSDGTNADSAPRISMPCAVCLPKSFCILVKDGRRIPEHGWALQLPTNGAPLEWWGHTWRLFHTERVIYIYIYTWMQFHLSTLICVRMCMSASTIVFIMIIRLVVLILLLCKNHHWPLYIIVINHFKQSIFAMSHHCFLAPKLFIGRSSSTMREPVMSQPWSDQQLSKLTSSLCVNPWT